MSDNNVKVSCNKENLDAIDLRLWIAKWTTNTIIIILLAIGIMGPSALGLAAYITSILPIWIVLFFLIGPAIFINIASTAASLGASACNDSIKKGKAKDSSEDAREPLTLQSFTPFFAAPFTQFRTMFKSI